MGRTTYLCKAENAAAAKLDRNRSRAYHSQRPVSAKTESGPHQGRRGWLRRLLAGAPAADATPSAHDRRLEAIAAISAALTRARDLETAARPLVEQVQVLLDVQFAAVTVVDPEATEATGIYAR